MPLYRFADFCVELSPLYPDLLRTCRGYEADPDTPPELSVTVTQHDIDAYRVENGLKAESDAYLERLLTYKTLCARLPEKDAFFLHSAVISYKGSGYAFSAESGTGKSTHIALWKKAFPHDTEVVNGDKPILRLIDNTVYAYGTPWCGKEKQQKNTRVPLRGLCFLERGNENRINRLSANEALPLLLKAILPPKTREEAIALLTLCDRLLRIVPTYRLSCTVSEEAAIIACRAMETEPT